MKKSYWQRYLEYRKENAIPPYVYDEAKDGTLYDQLTPVVLILLITNLYFDTFTYFYGLFYDSLTLFIILLLLWLILMQSSQRIKKSISKYLFVPSIILLLSFWTIPKIIHYYVIPKDMLCLQATLKSKRLIKGLVSIDFTFEKYPTTMLPKLQSLTTLHSIDGYQYNDLPRKGELIQICGEISKIGFSLDYVEAVR